MTKFVLDYSKWRSGVNGPYAVGKGNTEMLNTEGYMCCLGQFALQCGISKLNLLEMGSPDDVIYGFCEEDVNITDEIVKKLNFLIDPEYCYANSDFSENAISINDNSIMPVAEKISLLKALFNQKGIEMEVINAPEDVLSFGN